MSTDMRALRRLGRSMSAPPPRRPHRRRRRRRRAGGRVRVQGLGSGAALRATAGLRPRRRMPVRRVGPAARPRPRIPRTLAAMLVVGAALLVWLGVVATGQAVPVPTGDVDLTDASRSRSAPAAASRSGEREAAPFAVADGLTLAAPHPDPVRVLFGHAGRPEALALDGNGATSVAVAVPDGAPVLAPVTGAVAEVTEYPLHGSLHAWRITLQPAERPGVAVVLTGLVRADVAVGDAVTAGATAIGLAGGAPVTVVVTPALDPPPLDPNQPAQD